MTHQDIVALLKVHENDATLPDFDLFAAIALEESGGNPLAHNHNSNGTVDRGLWQINSIHQNLIPAFANDFRLACYTPETNCTLALAVFRMQGYHAWSSFNALP